MRLQTAIVIAVLFTTVALGQGRRQGGRRGNSSVPSDVMQAAVVHFEGILRKLDKKVIRIDLNDGQSLVFRRTKSTSLVASGESSGLETGDKVQVEARKDKVGDLEALRVCKGNCPAIR
jgi:hypothetical protein